MSKVDSNYIGKYSYLILVLLSTLFLNSCEKEQVLLSNTENKNEDIVELQKKEDVVDVQNKLSMGINLNGISFWSTQLPFMNHFKSSREWRTHCARKEVECEKKRDTKEYDLLDLDENGWVKSLPKPEDTPKYTRVSTSMFIGMKDNEFTPGRYLVLYDGEGKIEYSGKAKKIAEDSQPQRDVIFLDNSTDKGLVLTIAETDPNQTGNYIRNIKVIEERYESVSQQGAIFNPLFIERIKPFSTLRFMNWIETNNSKQEQWQDRPKVANRNYFKTGVPIEIMVALANELDQDPWLNIPHLATDEYITNFAQLVKENLDNDRQIYIEFSNEVWNFGFQQSKYAAAQGKARWNKEENSYLQWYGMKTAQMCDIWKTVFAEEKDRVKCVISTHTNVEGREEAVLDCPLWVAEGNKPCFEHGISIYAISGYFGGELGKKETVPIIESWLNQPDGGFESAFTQLKTGGLLANKKPSSLQEKYDLFVYHNQVAKEKNLELAVYEGGQHIVGRARVKNNKQLTSFFQELNRHPQMYDLYDELLNTWADSGGGLFMHFSDVKPVNKHGSWGSLEYLNDTDAPKYNALIDFINKHNTQSKK